jgi:hypothetical protein
VATYLMENEVDFDAHIVGFPGLGSCMGIVLHTDTGLFGFHCPPGMEDRVRGFAQFVRNHGHYGNLLGLYSGTRFLVRWPSNREVSWRQEMKYIATGLGYRGLVWGFDMTSPGTGITDAAADNAYLEFKLSAGATTPSIKMAIMTDLNVTRASVPSGTTNIRTVRPMTKTGYELRVPYSSTPGESRITTSVAKNPGVHKHRATGTTGFHYFNQA